MTEDKPRKNPAKAEETPPEGKKSKESGGPKGPEPTRYGDWEIRGKCVDF